VNVLRNEVADIGGLQVAGLDDLWAEQFDAKKTIAILDPALPAIALSHNPDTADLPVWDGFTGWILCGHTHGGQCKPPFLPPPILPVTNRRYTAGEFDLPGGRRMYINRGIGHLRQVRFNARPEVTLFHLQRA
jgi:predicted MPP superfamily phosphohydrolase